MSRFQQLTLLIGALILAALVVLIVVMIAKPPAPTVDHAADVALLFQLKQAAGFIPIDAPTPTPGWSATDAALLESYKLAAGIETTASP